MLTFSRNFVIFLGLKRNNKIAVTGPGAYDELSKGSYVQVERVSLLLEDAMS